MSEQHFAVLIGNNEFPEDSSLSSLRCPPNDVRGMHELLTSEEYGLFDDVNVLLNKDSKTAELKIHEVLNQASPGDLVLIYYSGHGRVDRTGKLHLVTIDTRQHFLKTTSIQLGQLWDLIADSRSRKIVLIIDCCYSGAASSAFIKKGSIQDQLANNFSVGLGTYVLTASTSTQVAFEREEDEFSILSKHIIGGVRTGSADANSDGFVSLDELYDYVYKNVTNESSQTPVKWELGVQGEHLIIARSGRAPQNVTIQKPHLQTPQFASNASKPRHFEHREISSIRPIRIGSVLPYIFHFRFHLSLISLLVGGTSLFVGFIAYKRTSSLLLGHLLLWFGAVDLWMSSLIVFLLKTPRTLVTPRPYKKMYSFPQPIRYAGFAALVLVPLLIVGALTKKPSNRGIAQEGNIPSPGTTEALANDAQAPEANTSASEVSMPSTDAEQQTKRKINSQESKRSVTVQLAPVYYLNGTRMYSLEMPVTLITSGGQYTKRLGRSKTLRFNNVPCNEEITIVVSSDSYNEGMFPATRYKRYITCDKSVQNLGELTVGQ